MCPFSLKRASIRWKCIGGGKKVNLPTWDESPGGKKRREKEKMDQFKERSKMSAEYTPSPKYRRNKMRHNSTGARMESQTEISVASRHERRSKNTPQHGAANWESESAGERDRSDAGFYISSMKQHLKVRGGPPKCNNYLLDIYFPLPPTRQTTLPRTHAH